MVSLDLRWSDEITDDAIATPSTVSPLAFSNRDYHAEFDSLKQYNANRTSVITTPPEDTQKVTLEAIISGHGDCEFEPTSHHWLVNGDEYNITFFGAGTQYGCQDQAIEGSIPNEHGTYYYGRDGWCDGAPVMPHDIDISDSMDLTPGSMNTIEYYAESYAADDDERFEESIYHIYLKPKTKTDGCQGYMLMSSNVIFYT